MIEHVSLRCADPKKSRTFYEKALAPLGYTLSKKYGDAFGFKQGGRHDFWIGKGEVATPNHVAFTAATREAVDAFYAAGRRAGGTDNGGPGMREDYGYAAFLYDPDGHNVEAICFDELEDGETLETVQKERIRQARGKTKAGAKGTASSKRKGASRRAPKKAGGAKRGSASSSRKGQRRQG